MLAEDHVASKDAVTQKVLCVERALHGIQMPIEVREHDGVLTLTFDTPGSRVNIFTRPTALQLCRIMAEVDPARTRSIVFRTAKRNSFINGVSVPPARAARGEDDAAAASAPARAAYRAVRESKVPTVAAIEGSCWGCGVAFALQCDYRIASDADNTQFYMTEVNDHLCLPLFGSTWELPATIGLERAIDLLLFGERWSAPSALAAGLLDAVVPASELDERVEAFARSVALGPRPERRVHFGAAEEAIVARAQARLHDLPPAYRVVYDGALALLVRGAQHGTSFDEHLALELALWADSAASALGKAAFGFSCMRQMAAQLSGNAHLDAPVRLDIVEGCATAPLLSELGRGSYVARESGKEERVKACDISSAPLAGVVAVADCPRAAVVHGWDAVAYAPMWGYGVRFVEISANQPRGRPLARGFAAFLGRAHVPVALSHANGEFASDRLIRAFLSPLAEFVRCGGDPAVIDATLRDMGFTHRPRSWAAGLAPGALSAILRVAYGDASALCRALATSHRRGVPSRALWAGVALSLLAAVDDDLAGFEHVVMVDLAARELLGFPLRETSLCCYLKTARVLALLQDADYLVGEREHRRAWDFAVRKQEFYC